MFEMVENKVCLCPICQKYLEGKDRDTLALMLPTNLHRRWHLDIVAMPRSREGYVCFVEAREELSNFVEARALRSKRSEPVGRFVLENIIACYGCIEILRGDGGELNEAGVKEFLRRFGIKLHFTTPYNPGANGKAERGHRSLLGVLRKSCDGHRRDWACRLPLAFWADRSTVSRMTGYMPAELLTGTRPPFPVDSEIVSWVSLPWTDNCSTEDLVATRIRQLERRESDLELAIARIRQEREIAKERIDASRFTWSKTIEVGEWVLVRNDRIYNEFCTERKLLPRWFGLYVVAEINTESRTYILREFDGSVFKTRYTGTRIRLFRRRDGTLDVKPLEKPRDEDDADFGAENLNSQF
ncbi:MAG: ribonuclease H-like domain-containing protein [Olpidium bornovanus]|uniref:Ribonuclease H-like domain-containing protein n=1 Tax=Olpidium bornovanus TaxID=278681 RepID=A0A8H8A232_9FUNG|nr:MAG: ribonuclease H-like domain-containing protein [Olpidium bornovanus]